jgi:RNA polymerase sigma-70 factor (ECF subfamily)
VRVRDRGALTAFFDAYFDQIYTVAFRHIGHHGAAEDVAQEVFLKVYRSAHRIDPNRDPVPWLMTITYNACRDAWRSSSRRVAHRSSSVHDSDRSENTLLHDNEDPESRLIAKERERIVQDALMRLPVAMRSTVILHDYAGLSHDQIAILTGVSHPAIRKRYSRALAMLGGILREVLE